VEEAVVATFALLSSDRYCGRNLLNAFPKELAKKVTERWENMVAGDYVIPPLPPIRLLRKFFEMESLGKRDFTLDEVYSFDRHLGDLYPGNQNVKPKIRQQLQFLRDRGFIEFVSRGQYRLRS
jgi:hypothetical protein